MSNYLGLKELKEKFKDQPFEILAFPCNQFGLQENSNNNEILPSLKHVRPGNGYEPNFPVFGKLKVNGDDAHPMYKWLRTFGPTKEGPEYTWVDNTAPRQLHVSPCQPNDVFWNFGKFLISKDGSKAVRGLPSKAPKDFEDEINQFLKE